ncbi:MAG: formyltransferase family protein, partial [Gammaproteobacteria bacterium]|nr:formyltransferase family protein [Gammaproteobacteria bacterium]
MSEIRKNRIVLLGYGRLALALLKGLLETGQCEIVGVFRWARHPRFRGRQDNDDKRLFDLTRDTKIPDLHFDGANSTDFHNFIEQNQVDTVLIATWGEIIRPPTLNIPGVRFVNCHPSLLPAHRGANPYSSVIRNGERQTGVTFHIVDESIDTGAIVLQSAVEVTEHDTGDTLRRRCAMTAKQLAAELCDRLNHPNKMTLTQQKDIGTPSYFPTLKPSDGLIDWSNPAKQIH